MESEEDKVVEKQVIVTWYTPEEKLPPEHEWVVVSFSGKDGNATYDHAIGIANYAEDGLGWLMEVLSDDAEFTIHAWADLDPYEG